MSGAFFGGLLPFRWVVVFPMDYCLSGGLLFFLMGVFVSSILYGRSVCVWYLFQWVVVLSNGCVHI